jgi:outer membrane receptor protein involved in Fe transport
VTGGYLDVVWRATPRVTVVPGVRADVYDVRGAILPSVDPRLSARTALAQGVTWVSTFGVGHQPPTFLPPIPGLQIAADTHGLQTSVQASQGVELALPAETTLTTTAFLHDYLDLADATATCLLNDLSTSPSGLCNDQRVRGRAYGLELLVRRSLTKRLGGLVSYTLSRSTRQAHAPTGNPDAVVELPSEEDRTHVLNVVGAYDLGRGWRAGARFYFYSGRPYSNELHLVPVPPFNAYRYPSFFRLDLRLEKRWRLSRWSTVAVVAEWFNATMQREATGLSCTATATLQNPTSLDQCTPNATGPVTIPSLGVEAQF